MTGRDRGAWGIAGALVAFDAAAIAWLGWAVQWQAVCAVGIAVTSFLVIGAVARRDPRLARIGPVCEALAVLCLLINASWVATYVTATSGAPLRDQTFHTADAAIGFSWDAWKRWNDAHPLFAHATAFAYEQHIWQVVLLVAVLAWRRPDGAFPVLRALGLTFLVTMLAATLFPAIGTQDDAAWSATFFALRSGTFHTIGNATVKGMVSMPSYHAVLAVLYLTAWWPVRWARWPAVVLDTLMLVGTVRWGAHYLVDVIAGMVLALAAARVTGVLPWPAVRRSSAPSLTGWLPAER
jgi:hypothetical protein